MTGGATIIYDTHRTTSVFSMVYLCVLYRWYELVAYDEHQKHYLSHISDVSFHIDNQGILLEWYNHVILTFNNI